MLNDKTFWLKCIHIEENNGQVKSIVGKAHPEKLYSLSHANVHKFNMHLKIILSKIFFDKWQKKLCDEKFI